MYISNYVSICHIIVWPPYVADGKQGCDTTRHLHLLKVGRTALRAVSDSLFGDTLFWKIKITVQLLISEVLWDHDRFTLTMNLSLNLYQSHGTVKTTGPCWS